MGVFIYPLPWFAPSCYSLVGAEWVQLGAVGADCGRGLCGDKIASMQTDTQTQTQDIGEQLQSAVLQAAFASEDIEVPTFAPTDPEVNKSAENGQKGGKGGVSPVNGVRTPGGRPKGVRNKLTNLRDAVLEAFDTVGGPAYLVQLAQGTQSDRAAFVSLVSKVLPTQVNAQVEGGVQIQLSWLGARSIGTTVAQSAEQVTQVVDLQRDSSGAYRIVDPVSEPGPASPGPEILDPPPPIDRQGGVGNG